MRFYCDVLGFKISLSGDADWAMLELAGTTLSLIKVGSDPKRSTSAPVIGTHPSHLGIVAADRKAVDEIYARIGKDLTPPKIHRDQSYGFYLRDPDDNSLEVIFIPEPATGCC